MPEIGPPSKTPMTPAEKIRGAAASDDSSIDSETDLWSGCYSHKAMAGTALGVGVLLIVGLIAMLAVSTLRSNGIAWISFAILVVVGVVGVMGLYLFRKWNRSYELTTQRFKHRVGILTRVSDRIELIDIDDVRVKQGPIQAIMGVGQIMVRSSDTSHPEFRLQGIDKVREVADMIDDARRTERRKRGLHIEAI